MKTSIVISASPAGSSGQIQFNNSGAFGADSALAWDNTNKRLGVGATPASTVRLDIRLQGALSTDVALRVRNSVNTANPFYINGLGNAFVRGSTNNSDYLTIGLDSDGTIRDAFKFGSDILNFGNKTWRFNAGTNGNIEGLIISNNATNSDQGLFTIQANNYCFGTEIKYTEGNISERRVMRLANGVAPSTSFTDGFKIYSADIVAGNAAPHFRTENGAVIKIYQETTGVAASTLVGGGGTALTDSDTFDGYTLKQVVKALRNLGILA